MADIFDWSATAANNVTVDGININTGMSPGNVDNAIRSLMALVRNTFVAGWEGLFAGTTSGIPVSNGSGTITAVAAPAGTIVGTTDTQTLTNKTLTSPTITGGAITGITDLAIADGGTGASTAAAAAAALGVVGAGQTWQAVSRSPNTSYQNTTGRPIQVAIQFDNQNALFRVSANGSSWVTLSNGDYYGKIQAIIPAEHYYMVSGSATINYAAELR